MALRDMLEESEKPNFDNLKSRASKASILAKFDLSTMIIDKLYNQDEVITFTYFKILKQFCENCLSAGPLQMELKEKECLQIQSGLIIHMISKPRNDRKDFKRFLHDSTNSFRNYTCHEIVTAFEEFQRSGKPLASKAKKNR
ncbi:unnamed protein product [Caenorhabditis angaria]|uniref:Uncharacterized protein n=1 Tax=Caenorhabditis angaria TaxID=860376 RepID=A0A9P1IDX1_9PELO|nr:unnamed protein product [Caenorhabditis angaria]